MIRYDSRNDAYELLGIASDAPAEEVEAAFRRAALRWHPDKTAEPGAADRFRRIQEAASVLRKPSSRRQYDRVRSLHLQTWRTAQRQAEDARGPSGPESYAPLAAPPPWAPKEIRVVRDSVLFPVPIRARSFLGEAAKMAAFMAAGAAIVTAELTFAALAVLLLAIRLVQARPPHSVTIAWAKMTPGQRLAEYTTMDSRAGLLVRHDVPFQALSVAVIERAGAFRVEIRGFPRGGLVLLEPTRDLDWARRCARDASSWLGLPLARAA